MMQTSAALLVAAALVAAAGAASFPEIPGMGSYVDLFSPDEVDGSFVLLPMKNITAMIKCASTEADPAIKLSEESLKELGEAAKIAQDLETKWNACKNIFCQMTVMTSATQDLDKIQQEVANAAAESKAISTNYEACLAAALK